MRLGYLARLMEGKKRYLAHTGKEYEPIVGDLQNYDKAYLKKEVADLNSENSENPYPFEDNKLYLKAFCEMRQENRSFKVDNIQDIKIL